MATKENIEIEQTIQGASNGTGRLKREIAIERSQQKNDCGPCATTTLLNYFAASEVAAGNIPPNLGHDGASVHDRTVRFTMPQVAQELRNWRLPGIGATLPWGIVRVLRTHGLRTWSGWLGTIDDIKRHIDADHPVIVLVRPTDLKAPFYSLHYRLVVGYNYDASATGGKLILACSARPRADASEAAWPGNLALSYEEFSAQWLTWVSVNWYVAAYPK